MADCLFCKIINRQLPAALVYEDGRLVAFKDIKPQAPTHILIVPRQHIATLNELTAVDDGIVGEMVRRAALVAKDLGHAEAGYRTLLNCNEDGGQSVYHIHLHLLAGRPLSWPPG